METVPKQRYLFIDLLRFLAVVAMLQGHTFDALVSYRVKEASLFYIYDFFHGFVAPMFLFASGVAFGVSTFRKWDSYLEPGPAFHRRAGRFIGLLVIGYALHLPFFSFSKIVEEGGSSSVQTLFQVDALQCIAITLLVLQLGVMIVRTRERFVLGAAIAAPSIIMLSPVVWNISFTGVLPPSIAAYLNAQEGSWFPLFPWAAYLLFGVVFAHLFLRSNEEQRVRQMMGSMALIGLLCVAAGIVAGYLPVRLYPPHDFWKVNPAAISARIGFILLVTVSLFWIERRVAIPSRFPTVMGKESLVIYVLHLLIIYGSVVNSGLQALIGPTLSVLQASVVFLLVLAAMSAFAYLWDVVKRNYRRESFLLKISLSATLLFYFFTRPY